MIDVQEINEKINEFGNKLLDFVLCSLEEMNLKDSESCGMAIGALSFVRARVIASSVHLGIQPLEKTLKIENNLFMSLLLNRMKELKESGQ
jgi:hypothetical protein